MPDRMRTRRARTPRRRHKRGASERDAAVSLGEPWRPAIILAMALAGAYVIVQALGILFQPIMLFLAATVIATAIAPLAARLRAFLPHVAAVLAIYFVVLLVVVGMGWIVIPPIVDQGQQLATAAPDLAEEVQAWLEERNVPGIENLEERIRQFAEQFAAATVSFAPGTLAASLELLMALTMSVYLAIAGTAIVDFVISLLPPSKQEDARDVLNDVGRTMGGYVRGTLLDGFIVGLIVYVGLTLLGVDFPLVLAVLAFAGELIPILGPWLAGIPAVGIALTDSVTLAVFVAIFYVALQQFESYVLLPNIMRSQADVPPLITLFALLAGAALAGFIGAILAIPLLGGAYVLVLRVVAPAIRSWTGAPDPEVAAADARRDEASEDVGSVRA